MYYRIFIMFLGSALLVSSLFASEPARKDDGLTQQRRLQTVFDETKAKGEERLDQSSMQKLILWCRRYELRLIRTLQATRKRLPNRRPIGAKAHQKELLQRPVHLLQNPTRPATRKAPALASVQY